MARASKKPAEPQTPLASSAFVRLLAGGVTSVGNDIQSRLDAWLERVRDQHRGTSFYEMVASLPKTDQLLMMDVYTGNVLEHLSEEQRRAYNTYNQGIEALLARVKPSRAKALHAGVLTKGAISY